MTNPILVTGGTGTVGRVVVERLLEDGREVRVLSRGRRPAGRGTPVLGDLRTGAGLDAAVADVGAVVHCADPADRLVDAAVRAGVPHLVQISIVGVDRVPLPYYRSKLADERLIAASGLGWTTLRTTQFHDLLAVLLRMLAKPPVLMVPSGWSFQPVDVRDVGARLAELALGEPLGRAPDLGGPAVRGIDDLAQMYLGAVGVRRRLVHVRFPGAVARAYAAGGHLAPDRRAGTITFERFLADQAAAGTLPYADAVRSWTRRRGAR